MRNVRHDAMPPYLVVLPRTTGGRALRNALHSRVNFVSPLALRFREQLQRRKLAAHLEITQRQAAQPYCCCSSAPSRKAPSSQTVGVGLATAVRRATAWVWSPTRAGEVGQRKIARLHRAARLEGSPEKCKVRVSALAAPAMAGAGECAPRPRHDRGHPGQGGSPRGSTPRGSATPPPRASPRYGAPLGRLCAPLRGCTPCRAPLNGADRPQNVHVIAVW